MNVTYLISNFYTEHSSMYVAYFLYNIAPICSPQQNVFFAPYYTYSIVWHDVWGWTTTIQEAACSSQGLMVDKGIKKTCPCREVTRDGSS
jgi:hypothetical protein